MNLTDLYNKAIELNAIAKDLKLANSALSEYQEAAEENYQQLVKEVDKWQDKFEMACQLKYFNLAHEALLVRNAYKEEARKLEAVIDKQLAQGIENLATLEKVNKLIVRISELIE